MPDLKDEFEKNYIPKSKVEEKIEEIQKEYEEILKTANFNEIFYYTLEKVGEENV